MLSYIDLNCNISLLIFVLHIVLVLVYVLNTMNAYRKIIHLDGGGDKINLLGGRVFFDANGGAKLNGYDMWLGKCLSR